MGAPAGIPVRLVQLGGAAGRAETDCMRVCMREGSAVLYHVMKLQAEGSGPNCWHWAAPWRGGQGRARGPTPQHAPWHVPCHYPL